VNIKLYFLFIIVLFAACRHNPPVRHTVISKICFASNLGYSDTVPYMRIEIDSALNYEFYGGDGCTKQGYLEGKTTKAFWDTLSNYLSAYIDSIKLIPRSVGPITCKLRIPNSFGMSVCYDDSKPMYIDIINHHFTNLLLNSYKTTDLKTMGADATYSFDIPLNNYSNNVPSTAEKMPVFSKGSLSDWLAKTITYPKKLQKKGIEGTVYATFIIEKDGSMSDIHILKGVTNGQELDKEVLRVLNTMPKWKPGMTNGKPVRVRYTLPVRFVLN